MSTRCKLKELQTQNDRLTRRLEALEGRERPSSYEIVISEDHGVWRWTYKVGRDGYMFSVGWMGNYKTADACIKAAEKAARKRYAREYGPKISVCKV